MQGRRWKWSTALVLLGVVACGDDAMELLGDAMVGVGDSMVAVGDAFVDVGDGMARDASSDAAAQPPTVLEAPCEVVGTRTIESLNGDGSVRRTSVQRHYAATFSVDFDPTRDRHLRALACGRIGANPYACPADSSASRCRSEGRTSYSYDFECVEMTPWFAEREVVVTCGTTTSAVEAGVTTENGLRYNVARIVVD